MSKAQRLLNVFEQKKEDIKSKVFDFLKENPYPEDDQVHEFAKSMGMEPDDLESEIYALLSDFIANGLAKEKGVGEKDVDKKELDMGIKVEMEHTNNPIIARRIALDHLAEISDYYTRLAKMEKEAEEEK